MQTRQCTWTVLRRRNDELGVAKRDWACKLVAGVGAFVTLYRTKQVRRAAMDTMLNYT